MDTRAKNHPEQAQPLPKDHSEQYTSSHFTLYVRISLGFLPLDFFVYALTTMPFFVSSAFNKTRLSSRMSSALAMADLKETQGPHGPMLYGTQSKGEYDDRFQRKVDERKEQQVCFRKRLATFHKASWGQRTKKRCKEEGFHNEVKNFFFYWKVCPQGHSRDWDINTCFLFC